MAWSRESRQARGYGAQWDRLRLLVLARDKHLCQCDECQGGVLRVRIATHVDHIRPKAQQGTDDMDNLRAVAATCHQRISLLQQGKKPRVRWQVGADGWPVDGSKG